MARNEGRRPPPACTFGRLIIEASISMGNPGKKACSSPLARQAISLQCDGVELHGDLCVPPLATGLVIFAHGSGSERHGHSNRFVAGRLHREKLATLLFDLMTVEEERADMMTGHLRFDIALLAKRLQSATHLARSLESTRGLPTAYFGSSTGAAAALVAASQSSLAIRAIVSRGGRPDLAREALRSIDTPTLLIVGGEDQLVLDANQEAIAEMDCERALETVPGATHLFEEPDALEQATDLAAAWLSRHLGKVDCPPGCSCDRTRGCS